MFAGRKVSFQLHITSIFIGLTLLTFLALGLFQFNRLGHMALTEAGLRFHAIGERTAWVARAGLKPGKDQAEALARTGLTRARTLHDRSLYIGYLAAALSSHELSTASYIAYPNGEFFLLQKWQPTAQLQAMLAPPAGTHWVALSMTMEDGGLRGHYGFYDKRLRRIEERAAPDYHFDARLRPWYLEAMAHTDGLARGSDPYLFASSGALGLSYAVQVQDSAIVVGVDVRLSAVRDLLVQQQATPSGRAALLHADTGVLALQNGAAVAHDPQLLTDAVGPLKGRPRLPTLVELDEPVLLRLWQQQEVGRSVSIEHEGRVWVGQKLEIALPGVDTLTLLLASPRDELLADLISLRNQSLLLTAALLALMLAVVYLVARATARPIRQLSDEAQKIQRFEFDAPINIRSHIIEVANLAASMGAMKSTISAFMQISRDLSSETNFDRLLSLVLSEVAGIAGAKGGVIYLHDPASQTLQPACGHLAHFGALSSQGLDPVAAMPALGLADTGHALVAAALGSTRIVSFSPQQFAAQFGVEVPVRQQPMTLIAMPLKDRSTALVGLIVLYLPDAHVDPGKQAMIESISGNAAVAIESRRLIDEHKRLLEAFIQLLAGAIDAKSPHTGGHCQRVPALTKMLAQAACEQTSGPYAGFQLSEGEWEELHIAAWLHDCGKVTTPEYIVDKATKLETLYDRIHEIRMRFELLKSGAQIAYWQGLAEGGDAELLKNALASELAALDADFAFVAACNEGGEFMGADQQARLRQIAERRWLRTLSDRLGISHEEQQRKQREPEAALPALEPLLADKGWHLVERAAKDRLAADNRWGFKVRVPEHLYNRGELYNLSVARGTLSEEERYKINEHIIQTIQMLETLPLPRHLARVAEIAGGHHEKMDGSGYPRRLSRDQLSLPARMMAVADIFEALTADDRPYKRGKTLSAAVRIMSLMSRDQHIDTELFALFLRSGVYLDYARRYMKSENIDAVDIDAALAAAAT